MARRKMPGVDHSVAGGARRAERARGDRFERLITAGLAIFAEHTLEGVLQRVADAARDVVPARYAALGVLNEAGNGLAAFVTSGLSQAEREQIGALPQGHGLLGLMIRERRPIRIANISRHPKRHGFPSHHPPMTSFLGVPVVSRDQVFGHLDLTEKIGAAAFDAEDEKIALFLARKAGVAVENARLLAQVQAVQASRDRFYAMMNHELRNALTGVYGWLELVLRRKHTPSRGVVEAFTGTEQAVQLLNDVLDLSRLDAGRLQVKAQDIMSEAVVTEALQAVAPMAEAAGVRLDAPQIYHPIDLRTDSGRVRQVLVNLLRNAIQHTPVGRAVRVTIAADDTSVSFSVADDGPGIAAELQPHLFDAFTRGNEDRPGTGLGLTLSRRLAQLLAGDLEVQSQPGQGATFTFRLARFLHPPS